MDERWGPVRERIDVGDLDGVADRLAAAARAEPAALLPVLQGHQPPTETAPPASEFEAALAYSGDHPEMRYLRDDSGHNRWRVHHLAEERARRVNEPRFAARALAIAAGTNRAADVVRAAHRT